MDDVEVEREQQNGGLCVQVKEWMRKPESYENACV